MIDTGASIVVLTPADAQRAGIALPDERTTGRAAPAARSRSSRSRIERLAIGPLEARDVRGAVADRLPVSLLGQSFLSQVGSVEITRRPDGAALAGATPAIPSDLTYPAAEIRVGAAYLRDDAKL